MNPSSASRGLSRLKGLAQAVPARTGVYYEELASGRIQTVAAESVFPAASVIKLPILLEVLLQQTDLRQRIHIEEQHKTGGAGVLQEMDAGLQPTLGDLCRLMIVVSDNIASNLLLDQVGSGAVNRLMAELGMTSSHLGRRFMEQPTPGRDNRMSPSDAGRCLAAVWRQEVLAEPVRSFALDILRRQQYREKIPLLLPPEVPVYHKTGELEGVRHDAAIVEHPRGAYVLVVFTADGGHPWEVDAAIARLSRAVYDGLCDRRVE